MKIQTAKELTELAKELNAFRKSCKGGGVRFPLEMRQRVGQAVKLSDVTMKDASVILGLHHSQLYEWKKLKAPVATKSIKRTGKPVDLKSQDGFTLRSEVSLAAVKYHISRFQAGELTDPDTHKLHIQSAIEALGVIGDNTT